MELNERQFEALDVILSGHNLLITGPSGSGKSNFIKHVDTLLSAKGLNVAVTATTGIACTLYDNAMTLHKWSGIGDGRYEKHTILDKVLHFPEYADVRKRITTTDVLIVDEVSMLSLNCF